MVFASGRSTVVYVNGKYVNKIPAWRLRKPCDQRPLCLPLLAAGRL
jgi:hypothetical protein